MTFSSTVAYRILPSGSCNPSTQRGYTVMQTLQSPVQFSCRSGRLCPNLDSSKDRTRTNQGLLSVLSSARLKGWSNSPSQCLQSDELTCCVVPVHVAYLVVHSPITKVQFNQHGLCYLSPRNHQQLNLQRSLSLALLRIYSHSDPTPYVAEMHLQLRLGLCIVITTGIGHKSKL